MCVHVHVRICVCVFKARRIEIWKITGVNSHFISSVNCWLWSHLCAMRHWVKHCLFGSMNWGIGFCMLLLGISRLKTDIFLIRRCRLTMTYSLKLPVLCFTSLHHSCNSFYQDSLPITPHCRSHFSIANWWTCTIYYRFHILLASLVKHWVIQN